MSKARLIECVQRLDLSATRELLKAKPSLIAVTDRQGRNLLQLACCMSWSKVGVSQAVQARFVKFLLDQGYDIDAPVVASLKLLIRAGARTDIVVGMTPF